MIKLHAIGHLGKDALVNNVSGKTVINFNVAHTEKYKDAQGTEVQKTVWVACAYWSDKTKIAQYLLKGSQVFVEGVPDIKMYKNAQGEVKANIVLRVSNIQLLGGVKQNENTVHHPQPSTANTNNTNGYVPMQSDISLTDDSDLPF